MNADNQNQNFEKLQHLLKVKRYEQPPPRFFNDFSGQVTARLRAGETGKLDTFEEAVSQSPWLKQLWRFIEGRPAVSGLFATGVCGLILASSFLSGKMPVQPGLALESEDQSKPVAPGEGSLLATTTAGASGAVTFTSTNPTSVLPGSLFNLSPNVQAMPASGRPISP
jgi:hypothetical protein